MHEKWVNIRTLLQTKLINILNIHTNPDFKFLAECTEWVAQKLVSSPTTDVTNTNICSTGLVYDHWAAASTELRRQLLIPLSESSANTTVVRIEEGHKTVITMGGVGGPTNFRFLEDALDWVTSNLVSSNSMGVAVVFVVGVLLLAYLLHAETKFPLFLVPPIPNS